MKYTFRFDDVCINSDMNLTHSITELLLNKFEDCDIIYGVSPLVHFMGFGTSITEQRVFPKELNAISDYRNYYHVNNLGIPIMTLMAKRAGHGLIHVDHRLLHKSAQELSIVASCSLVNAKIFIPPFNKWNKDTEEVCKENGIELIKFEDGWLSMEHNKFNPKHEKWYLHAREWTLEKIKAWFGAVAE